MEKTSHVKAFFEDTDKYLKNNYGIAFRRDIIAAFTRGESFSSILDVGCGDGSLSAFLLEEGTQLTLLDISENMLSKARKKFTQDQLKRVKFLLGDVDRYEFDENQFDLIIAVGLLAHVPSVESVIQKLSKCLKLGGYLILQFTDHGKALSKVNYKFRNNANQYQVNKIYHDEILILLNRYSFSILKKERYSLLLPGFGRLGDKFLYWYTHFTRKTFLKGLGTDILLMVKKK